MSLFPVSSFLWKKSDWSTLGFVIMKAQRSRWLTK